MKKEFFFKLPESAEQQVTLIENIPLTMNTVTGTLTLGFQHRSVGANLLHLSLNHGDGTIASIEQMRSASKDNKVLLDQKKGFIDFLVNGKVPMSVGFDHTGAGFIDMSLSKQIAGGLVRKGYTGWIHFSQDGFRREERRSEYWCHIQLAPWDGRWDGEPGPQPARVKIGFDISQGGSEEDIALILEFCRDAGFVEYTLPTPAQA